MKTLRILLADDHDIVREGLRMLLGAQEHWQVCGEATTGREAVDMATQLKPDIIVLDLSMPELNGLEATRQIRKILPESEILILTMHDSETLASDALAAGARGFLLKTDTRHQLIPAITTLATHQPFFTPKVSALLLNVFLHPETRLANASDPSKRLTPREREVVQLIAEGKTSKDIAVRQGLSVKTVEAHRANIMHKLGVRSASELVLYAVRNQIIQA